MELHVGALLLDDLEGRASCLSWLGELVDQLATVEVMAGMLVSEIMSEYDVDGWTGDLWIDPGS